MPSNPTRNVNRVCENCGSHFLAYRNQVNRGGGRFCSPSCTYAARRANPEARFWPRVQKGPTVDDCWVWLGGPAIGYGQFHVDGRAELAHRFSYVIHYGPIPNDLFILHTCPSGDNPRCVNPAHLRAGTPADNMRDRGERGRSPIGDKNGTRLHPERLARGERNGMRLHPEKAPRGEHHGNAKLSEQDVLQIRYLNESGQGSYVALALRFGISKASVADIVTRRTWQHV